MTDIAAAYARCEEITRTEARNFSYGIRLLPPERRGALSAIYALARRLDDIGDEAGEPEAKLARLAEVREQIAAIGAPTDDPVLIALADAADRLPISLQIFDELVDGVEADVRGTRYETIDELVGYCRQVAGSVGRLSLGAFGGPDTPLAVQRADTLGVALQLTNILRDVREDLQNGRIYLPAADLRHHGVELRLDDDGNIAGSRVPLVALMRFEAARAEAWYLEGLRLLPMLDSRSAACCGAMSSIYHRLLARIAARPDRALEQRMSLPAREKLSVAFGSLARAAVSR